LSQDRHSAPVIHVISPVHVGTFQSSKEAGSAKRLLKMIENRRGNTKKLKFLMCIWHSLRIH